MLSGVGLRELAAGARHTAALATDGTVYVWTHGQPPRAGAPPPLPLPALPVACPNPTTLTLTLTPTQP